MSDDGWEFWLGSKVFSVLSGDFDGNARSQISSIANLFIDLSYKRFGIALHVSNVENDDIYDNSGKKIDRVARVVQYFLKDRGYKLLATSCPYTKWSQQEIDGVKKFNDTIQSNDVIIIDGDKNTEEPSQSSIQLLSSCDFPFKTDLKEENVKKIEEIKPIKQEIGFLIPLGDN